MTVDRPNLEAASLRMLWRRSQATIRAARNRRFPETRPIEAQCQLLLFASRSNVYESAAQRSESDGARSKSSLDFGLSGYRRFN